MRQRNDTDAQLTVHTDPPQIVDPGQTVDHDTPIVGLTALPDEPPTPPTKTRAVKTTDSGNDKEVQP